VSDETMGGKKQLREKRFESRGQKASGHIPKCGKKKKASSMPGLGGGEGAAKKRGGGGKKRKRSRGLNNTRVLIKKGNAYQIADKVSIREKRGVERILRSKEKGRYTGLRKRERKKLHCRFIDSSPAKKIRRNGAAVKRALLQTKTRLMHSMRGEVHKGGSPEKSCGGKGQGA